MAGKLSPRGQTRMAELGELDRRIQSVHGLVEQYAIARANLESLEIPLRRGFAQLKMHFMGAGIDAMSQLAGSMEMTLRRGLAHTAKTRILRDAIGTMRFQVELEQRAVVSAERERAAAEAERAED